MVLVFDVGATHTRVALADHGELRNILRMDTDTSAAGFARFMGVLEEISKGHKLTAVAGGMPCQFEGDDGHIAMASNLPDWVGLPVLSRMEKSFDCPVNILNDVEMCGLGEAHRGAGVAIGVMAYFTVSTGVNAVRIVDGRIDASIDKFEMGALVIGSQRGKDQSLESLTGGAAMAQRLGSTPKSIRDPEVWKAEERSLARGLYDVILAWTPDLVVFGGSMMRDIDLLGVRSELEQMPKAVATWPRLEYAILGDEGGLQGALAWIGHT